MATTRHLDVTETAKLIQKRLKHEFPGTPFSVRSDRYADGASIRVRWTDGPLISEVKAITDGFEGAGFDGMIDLQYYKQHWLRPDGTTLIHYTPGTQGSRGIFPEEDNRMLAPVMPGDAELVSFGADFVFTTREISNHRQRSEDAMAWIYQNCTLERNTGEPSRDRFNGNYLPEVAFNLLLHQKTGESLENAFRRAYCPPEPEPQDELPP